VEQQCNKFFGNVYRWTNDTGFNRKEITLGGAAAAGVLAALGVSAQAIALTAIGFALTADSMDAFQNFALFTTNPHAVAKLVDDAMKAYKTSAPPGNQTLMVDHQTALAYVSGYAQLCTYQKIQDFVAQALANATPVDVSKVPISIFSVADRILLGDINQDLGLSASPLNDEQYAQLYWYLKEGYSNDQNRQKVLNTYSTIASDLWDATKNILPPAAQRAELKFEAIALTNSAFKKAEQAVATANPPAATSALQGVPVAPAAPGSTGLAVPGPILSPSIGPAQIPNIQIR